MTNLRKHIAQILILSLCITSLTFSFTFAAEKDTSNKLVPTKSNLSLQALEEINILEEHGISKEFLIDVNNGEPNQYIYQLPNVPFTSVIHLQKTENSVIIFYTEGSLHNKVEHFNNGDVYLDDCLVTFTSNHETENGPIKPTGGVRTDYSDTPFIGDGSGYNTTDSGYEYNVETRQPLLDLTISALADILKSAIKSLIRNKVPYSAALQAADLINHATSIQGLAHRANKNPNYLSFRWSIGEHQNNTAVHRLYKYSFKYYLTPNCTGSYTSATLYQRSMVC